MSGSRTFKILSGEDRSLSARLVRTGLSLASACYATATDLRNLAYERGLLSVRKVGVPVISVGNLTTGGTGKTPMVAWLVRRLLERGCRPGILSRGYRSLDGQENDEKRLLDRQCPGVPHVQNKDRVAGAHRLLREFQVDVIVLDDGFQHRRLHRDFDLVLIDALNPWGYDRLLPRGLLRERKGHLRRADAVLLTRCELTGESRLAEIDREIDGLTHAPRFRTAFDAVGLVDHAGRMLPIEQAVGRSVCAFCGIGNPQAFRRTLARMAAPVSDDRLLVFPDHHHYDERDLRRIGDLALREHAELVLTTRKDLVKLNTATAAGRPILAVEIETKFQGESAPLLDALNSVLARTTQVD